MEFSAGLMARVNEAVQYLKEVGVAPVDFTDEQWIEAIVAGAVKKALTDKFQTQLHEEMTSGGRKEEAKKKS